MPFRFGLTSMRTTRRGRGVSHFGQKFVGGPDEGGATTGGWRAWVMGEFGF